MRGSSLVFLMKKEEPAAHGLVGSSGWLNDADQQQRLQLPLTESWEYSPHFICHYLNYCQLALPRSESVRQSASQSSQREKSSQSKWCL